MNEVLLNNRAPEADCVSECPGSDDSICGRNLRGEIKRPTLRLFALNGND